MKKINSTLIFLLLGIAISSLFLSSCKKDITENIDLRFKPTLFEYTGLIRVYDAADSTVPNNLDIVFAAGQENLLYSIFGDKELKFSPSGTLEFGLHPAVKPMGTEPVVIRFDLTAPGYISQPFSIEFYEGRPSIRKEFSLMNKSNLPEGVSYSEFSGTLKDGVTMQDIVINLGGGQLQNDYKNSEEEAMNTIIIHPGTKFYYWDYNPDRVPVWERTEVVASGQISGQAYFYQYFPGLTGYRGYANGFVIENGDTTAIPSGSIMAGMGGWYFGFTLNGQWIFPDSDQPGEFSATANLTLPKYGFNLETGELYQAGDVIKLYNFIWTWNWNSWSVRFIYDLVSTQVLSETSLKNSDYFSLEPIELDNLSMLWNGSIMQTVDYFDFPEIRVAGDNSEPSWNNSDYTYQYLMKKIQFNGEEYEYYFGGWFDAINNPVYQSYDPTIPAFSFLPGTYKKYTWYNYTYSDGPSTSILSGELETQDLIISAGSSHPFDYIIPAGKLQRVTLDYSIKCDNAEIRPSVSIGVGSLYGPDDTATSYPDIYVYGYEGFASSYTLKVGQAYKFYLFNPNDNKYYMRIDTVKSANTVIEINNAEVCDFIDSGGF